jgi:ABC-2 type transport system permease protein
MNPGAARRINALILQEFYITRRSMETIIDLYFFPSMAIMAFGLLSLFLVKSSPIGGDYLILGLVLWEVVRINQYSISVSSLWSVWSHNLSNLFVAPLTLTEYVLAQIISAIVKTLVAFIAICVVVAWLFHLNLLDLGLANLTLDFINLAVFAWALGLVLLGLIFLYGTRIQSLSWGVVFAFQPLCAVFFPVSILPKPMQLVAYAFPPTHIFEAARANLTTTAVQWSGQAWAAGLNAVYLTASVWAFGRLVRRSQTTGQFAKNDL